MTTWHYHKAQTLAEALTLLATEEAVIPLAGATNLLVDIRHNKRPPGLLLEIGALPGLAGIELAAGLIRIGALTTVEALANSPLLRTQAPALAQAALQFADPLIRKRATLGGNLVNASPAADLAPPLLALQARVLLQNSAGSRKLPLDQFFLGPGRTARQPQELLLGVEFAPCPASAFLKLGLRKAMAISLATAAAALVRDAAGGVQVCRLGLGALAPTPLRARLTEAEITRRLEQGEALAALSQESIAPPLLQEIAPIDDLRASAAYRREIAPVLVLRALRQAAEGRIQHES